MNLPIALSVLQRALPWLAAVLAALIYAVLHRVSIEVTPDGWAYWQGAASIIEGKGFVYFSGVDITDWPPLYSLYLAAWILLLGPTGLCLILANGALIAVQSAGWMRLARALDPSPAKLAGSLGGVLAVIYIGLFVPLWQGPALAHNLLYTILPFQAALTLSFCRSKGQHAVHLSTLTAASAMLMLTHNSAIVFVAASGLMVFLFAGRSLLIRTLFSAIVTAVPLCVWWAVRILLGQDESHPVSGGRFSVIEYVQQGVAGIGELVFPPEAAAAGAIAVGLAVLWVFTALKADNIGRWGVVLSTAVPFVLLVIVFSVTWIYDPLSGARFMLFAPLVAFPAGMTVTRHRPAVLALLAALTLPFLVYRTVTAALTINPTPDFPNAVGWRYELSHLPEPGHAIAQEDGRVLAAPPRFEWETQEESVPEPPSTVPEK